MANKIINIYKNESKEKHSLKDPKAKITIQSLKISSKIFLLCSKSSSIK